MGTMTIDGVRTRLESFFEAFNDRDPEALLALCREDVVWDDPARPGPIVGWEAVADLLAAQFTAFADLHFPQEEIEIYRSLDAKSAAAWWSMVVTMTGRLDPPGYEPTGKTVAVSGMSRFEFDPSGLIARYRAVYDTMALARRLGLLPDTDSLQFKALVGLEQAEQLGRKFVRHLRR